MVDATGDHANDAIWTGAQLVGYYVTGLPPVPWSATQIMSIRPGQIHVPIDQGAAGAPRHDAIVQDVETGAWTPADVPGWQADCTAEQPTVYCNQSTLPDVLATGWTGNLWLAVPGWQYGEALPSAPGCHYVAVQNQLDVLNAYDLSVVLDDDWPYKKSGARMPVILTVDRNTVPQGTPWPGSWLLRPDGTVTWLDQAHYQALLHAGAVEQKNYAYEDWKALAGVQ